MSQRESMAQVEEALGQLGHSAVAQILGPELAASLLENGEGHKFAALARYILDATKPVIEQTLLDDAVAKGAMTAEKREEIYNPKLPPLSQPVTPPIVVPPLPTTPTVTSPTEPGKGQKP